MYTRIWRVPVSGLRTSEPYKSISPLRWLQTTSPVKDLKQTPLVAGIETVTEGSTNYSPGTVPLTKIQKDKDPKWNNTKATLKHKTSPLFMPSSISKLTHDSHIQDFVRANKEWRDEIAEKHSLKLFTEQSAQGQEPHTMLIACCDSRYNETCFHTLPGEIFTYRVIGNMCIPSDLHLMSSMEYAIRILGVKRIILCGHTDCGAIKTILKLERGSLLDKDCPYLHSYLADIEDLYLEEHSQEGTTVLKEGSFYEQSEYLAFRNLERNFKRLIEMDMVKRAVEEKGVEVYGMIYRVSTGLVETVSSFPEQDNKTK